MNPNIKTVTMSVEIINDLAKIGAWIDQREKMLRWIVDRYAAIDPEGSLNVLSLEDAEFIEILDGLRKTADYLEHLHAVVNGGPINDAA